MNRASRSPRPRTLAVPLLFALVSLLGCSDSPDGADAAIVLADGDVEVVGTSDAIAEVVDLEVLPDGRVWVLNSTSPYFVGFGPDGSVLGAHGARGGGPGELALPAAFVAGGLGGEAWAFDRGRQTLVQASPVGTTPNRVDLPSDAIPQGSVTGGLEILSPVWTRMARAGDEVIVPRTVAGEPSSFVDMWRAAWGADLVALEPRTGEVRTVLALGRVLGDPTPHFELLEGGFPPLPLWPRLWAVCRDDEIALYDRIGHRVRRFGMDGVEREPTSLPQVEPSTVSPREFAQATLHLALLEAAPAVGPGGRVEASAADSARVLGQLVPRVDAPPERLATLLPRFVDLRCGEGGSVWLQPVDVTRPGLAGGARWARVDANGNVRDVRFPERFDPYRFVDGRVWGVLRDALGVASVARVATPN